MQPVAPGDEVTSRAAVFESSLNSSQLVVQSFGDLSMDHCNGFIFGKNVYFVLLSQRRVLLIRSSKQYSNGQKAKGCFNFYW